MNSFHKSLVVFLLLVGTGAQAMTFPQFDHMVGQDRRDFLDLMVDSAHKVLVAQGREADAAKMHKLFHDISPGSSLPLGEGEMEMNLDNARVRSMKKAIENTNAPPVQVETALAGTLMKNGISMTPDFIKAFVQLTSAFKPKYPPLRVSAGDAFLHAQDIRQGKRGIIKDAMGALENTVERDVGTEDDASKTSDAILTVAGSTPPMTFPQFDNMAGQDRQDYLTFLVSAAQQVFVKQGRQDVADKIGRFFNDIPSEAEFPIGEAALELNLDNARVADVKRDIQNRNLPRIPVEAALVVTLKKNGFELSPDFLKGFAQLVSTFQPKLPPMNADSPVPQPSEAVPTPNPIPSPPTDTTAPTNQVTPPADDDDPIGAGGFITPPATDSPNK